MSYSDPRVPCTYNFAAVNFATTVTITIKPPPGVENGRIEYIHARATTTFTNTTTEGHIRAGISGTLAKYADVPLGTLAANASLANTAAQITSDGERLRVADGDVLLTLVAPTGGTPAGVADVLVHINWW